MKSDSSQKYTQEETKNVGRRGRTRRVPSVHPKGPFVVSVREFNSICQPWFRCQPYCPVISPAIKLANRLGLCSRSCLPVWAETASTCWVFTTKCFRSESNYGVIRRWFFKFWTRRLSQQVHGLRNRCTFALENGLAGRFISRYWVSLIGFDLCPFRELVWHLSTQVNIGNLAV